MILLPASRHLFLITVCIVHFILHSPPSSLSQGTGNLSAKSVKAEKSYRQAVVEAQARNLTKALLLLEKALDTDPQFPEALALTGDILAEQGQAEKAIHYYGEALKLAPDLDYRLYAILGNLEMASGLYKEAKEHYLYYLSFQKGPANRRAQIEENIIRCATAINLTEHPVPFHPVNLGDSINTVYDEYINAISADQQMLYFTRRLPSGTTPEAGPDAVQEDFFLSRLVRDTVWGMAENLGPPINTRGNEGAISISPDGQFLLFAACQREDGYGSCDLYWSRKMGDHWTEPRNLGPVVNSPAWDSQPSFSSDGKTLYFASKREGGKGGADIWRTELLPGGEWTVPVNLGDSINTSAEEQSPFIHPDNQTLYFASRGHPGMGGLDLFCSRRGRDGSWKGPVNLGFPINTQADEITLVINTTGDVAYISSDKLGGKGRQDIYAFPVYPEARPNPVTYLKGTVFDAETGKRLQARFELTDLERNELAANSVSDPVDGSFLLCLPTDREYALAVSRDGYLFYSDHFSLIGVHEQATPFLKNIPLQPIRPGETVVLRNIFFDTDKFDLKPESCTELDRLAKFLIDNPALKIEISGHTDSVGTEKHNLELSKNRAGAVFNYLVQHGIDPGRLTYAGYGFSRPIDSDETETGRANNRRTEFRILGNN
jgi:outer membrane protein OmpA-like peptidoglycan-associated protein